MRIIPLTTLCARCHRPLGPLVSSSRPLHSTAHDEPASAISHPEAGFDEWSRELQRRKRKTDAKRRQKVSQCFEVGPERMYAHEQGASFVDHIIGTVRGGVFMLQFLVERSLAFGIKLMRRSRRAGRNGLLIHFARWSRSSLRRERCSRRLYLPDDLPAPHVPLWPL